MPDLSLLRHPAFLTHAGSVLGLLVLSPLLGGDDGNVAQLGLIVLGVPWSAFVLGTYGAAFDVLIALAALVNVALHGWARARLPHQDQQGRD